MNQVVIDATGAPVGRIASFAAKQALLGKDVKIVNCNGALVTGSKKTIIEEYRVMRQRGGSSLKGPFYPKSPERIMKRTIRGMMSYKQGRGRDAFSRVKCYNTTPAELEAVEKTTLARAIKSRTLTLAEIGKEL